MLVPFLGTQRTFLAFAVALALVAATGLGWRFVAVPAALAAAIALPVGTVKATGEGRVIYEAESDYQYIRVVERDDGERVLELNEGQATHSLYRPGKWLTGDYWDGLLVLPFVSLDDPPERIAILGNAAGTAARAYGHFFPARERRRRRDRPRAGARSVAATSTWARTPASRSTTRTRGRGCAASEGDYDVIVVDAYRQPYIPFYLATREFFELVRDRLAPGGSVVINVGHAPGNDDLERIIGRTMAAEFEAVLRDPVEDSNTLLVASEAPASAEHMLRAIPKLPRGLQALAATEAGRLGPRLPGGEVYTDDRAPVEWLIDRSILGYAAGD